MNPANQKLEKEITDRKQAEEALREREEFFRHLVEGVRDYAIFMLDPEGRIASWNAGAQRIKGYRAEEIIGQHFSRFYPPEDVASGKPEQELKTTVAEGRYEEEGWRVRKDGTWFWANVVITPVRDETGQLRGFAKVTRDITERRWAEEALRRANDRLKETNAELESFTYTISHDLRAPLRAMQGFADALQEDYADRLDPTGRDYTRRIAAAARRMDTLIQDLLSYSRLSRADLQLETVALASVTEEARAQLEADLRNRKAQVTVDEPLPAVKGHAATLVQIVANLMANAIKFVAPEVTPQVKIWAQEQKGWVRLCVKDNGIGIAPEHRERIFRVFERLHGADVYPGTGIGLAIVRKGMERMGGRAGVESEVGQGSQFWIELPKAEER
ncbi:MAG: PAS domain-containing sensor histidine kinase [Candidatus Latescibacteria bacterium]|nr:PAS domain-containing sensor histidine kinase [Candidatus Latescibacterota bacterium]